MKARKGILAIIMSVMMVSSIIPVSGISVNAESAAEEILEVRDESADLESAEPSDSAGSEETVSDAATEGKTVEISDDSSDSEIASDNANVADTTEVTADDSSAVSPEDASAGKSEDEKTDSVTDDSSEYADSEKTESADNATNEKSVEEKSQDFDSSIFEKSNEELTEEEIEAIRATDVDVPGGDAEVIDVEATDIYDDVELSPESRNVPPDKKAKDESHELVLLLDVSGSMSGKPMTEMKKACNNFISEILEQDPDSGIGIVTFASNVHAYTFQGSHFSNNESLLKSVINGLTASGNTAMYDGMVKADEILSNEGTAKRKYIITMADGLPNSGYSFSGSGARFPGHSHESGVYKFFESIESGYEMYSLGFFHGLNGSTKEFAAEFMESISNRAYFEVTNADLISFTFEEIAMDINSEQLKLSQTSLAMAVGDSKELTLEFTEKYNNPDKTVIWGSSNNNIAKVDKGVVTAIKEGECIVTATAGGYVAVCNVTVTKGPAKLGKKILTIHKNKNKQTKKPEYVLAKDAEVLYEGQTFKANSNGVVTIQAVSDTGDVTVMLEGYRSRVFDISELGDSEDIYLQKETDNPIINSVYIGSKDVLVDELDIDPLKTTETEIVADVDWGKSSCDSLILSQDAVSLAFDNGKINAVLKDKGFDTSKTIYITAKDKAGKSTKMKLQLIATSNKILNGLDGFNVSLGRGDLSFSCPENWFIIGGQKIKIDIDKLDKWDIPINVSVDGDIVQVSGGIDVAGIEKKKKTSGKTVLSKEDEKHNVFKDIKEALTKKTEKEVKESAKSLKEKYKDAIRKPTVSFGVSGDFSILFYIEGYVDSNGKVQFLDGKVCLCPEVGVNWDGQFAIGPVPCYWEAAIKGAIEATLNLKKNQLANNYIPDGSIELAITGEAGAGLGVKKLASVGGGASLKFKPKVNFYSTRNPDGTVYIGLNGYFKLTLFALEYRHDFDPIDKTWPFESSGTKNAAAPKALNMIQESMYDADLYHVADVSYLGGESIQIESRNAAAAPNELENDIYAAITDTLHKNSYLDSQPQMVRLSGDTKLAVWLDADNSGVNSLKLTYSYFDGNKWSDPAAVDNDGTPDNAPVLCVKDNRAFVIWQNAEREFAADDTLDKLAPNMGIKVAEFKPALLQFDVEKLSENSGYLDMMPQIQYAGDTVVAAWIENSNNNWFSAEKDNKIMTSVFDGSTWSTPEVTVTGAGSVNSLAVDYRNGKVYAVYSEDMDQNLDTIEDLELCVNGVRATSNETMDSAVYIKDHVLYWYSDSKIMVSEVGDSLNPQSLMGGDVTIPTDQFRILENGEDKAVIFAGAHKSASDIYGIFRQDDNTWGYPIRLTARNNSIQQFDGIWDGDNLVMLCNEVKVNDPEADPVETNYGQSDLVVMQYNIKESLALNDVSYIDSDIAQGSALPITLSVTNNGVKPVSGVHVELLDESGNTVDSLDVNTRIMSGNSANVDYGYVVKAQDIGKEYTVKCTPIGGSNTGYAENTAKVSFSYEDIAIDNLSWEFGEKADDSEETDIVISCAAQNLGYSAKDNVKVTLYDVPKAIDEESGEEIVDFNNKVLAAEENIGTLSALDQKAVQFRVPVPEEFDYQKLYYAEITCDNEEGSSGNNSGYLSVREAENYSLDRTIVDLSVYDVATEFEAGSSWNYNSAKVLASYDDGSCAEVDATIDASEVNIGVAGTYTMHVTSDGFTKNIGIIVREKKNPGATIVVSGEDKAVEKVSNHAPVGSNTIVDNIIYEVIETGDVRKVKVSGPTDNTLTSADIKSSVTIQNEEFTVVAIGDNAFKDCTGLKSVALSDTIEEIGDSAFSGCSSLKKFTITANVNKIGRKAFYNASALKKVTIKSTNLTLKNVGSKAFSKAGSGNYKKLKVKVPKKKLALYKKILKKKGLSSKAKVQK
ncbi:leucine-rich repeat protein [Butyrivibrio sp. WCD3002]|uniref:leucine-rich repeat protein n=1 Tax=Butyrivibrio sp. WCD3002 TaxID=1280676 RepID=UPI0003F7DA77|nr:leucine-rich repeat protein [Butyrivibrio sp. WCD3002]